MMNKVVGITGGIGSGKSTVSKIFEVLGVPVFMADVVAKEIVEIDHSVIEKIKESFGKTIYDGALLNRKKLGELVFADPVKLKILNKIIHPAVAIYFENWLKTNVQNPYVIRESAIMFESGIYKSNQFNVLVKAPLEMRVKRIAKRDGLAIEQIMNRMQQQWNDEERQKFADYDILNDNETPIIPQVLKLHQKFMEFFQK